MFHAKKSVEQETTYPNARHQNLLPNSVPWLESVALLVVILPIRNFFGKGFQFGQKNFWRWVAKIGSRHTKWGRVLPKELSVRLVHALHQV